MTSRIALIAAAILSVSAPAMAQSVDMSGLTPRLTFPEPAPTNEVVTKDRQAK